MKALSISPNLIVKDVNETVKFYTEVLKFNYVMGVDNEKQLYLEFNETLPLGFAIVQSGKAQIMIQEINNIKDDGFDAVAIDSSISNIALYVEIDALDDYYADLKDKVEIVHDMRNTFYGMKEFYLRDCNGNILGFAEKLV